MISTALSQILLIAFMAYLAQSLLNGGVREELAAPVDPNAMLLAQRRVTPGGAQCDLLTRRFGFQSIARRKLQFQAQALRKDDTARFVHRQFGNHNGIMKWYFPYVNGIIEISRRLEKP